MCKIWNFSIQLFKKLHSSFLKIYQNFHFKWYYCSNPFENFLSNRKCIQMHTNYMWWGFFVGITSKSMCYKEGTWKASLAYPLFWNGNARGKHVSKSKVLLFYPCILFMTPLPNLSKNRFITPTAKLKDLTFEFFTYQMFM
jgi:hypothetical protein